MWVRVGENRPCGDSGPRGRRFKSCLPDHRKAADFGPFLRASRPSFLRERFCGSTGVTRGPSAGPSRCAGCSEWGKRDGGRAPIELRRSSTIRCPYVSAVRLTSLCWRIRWTRCSGTPARRSNVAVVCRKSWNRIGLGMAPATASSHTARIVVAVHPDALQAPDSARSPCTDDRRACSPRPGALARALDGEPAADPTPARASCRRNSGRRAALALTRWHVPGTDGDRPRWGSLVRGRVLGRRRSAT